MTFVPTRLGHLVEQMAKKENLSRAACCIVKASQTENISSEKVLKFRFLSILRFYVACSVKCVSYTGITFCKGTFAQKHNIPKMAILKFKSIKKLPVIIFPILDSFTFTFKQEQTLFKGLRLDLTEFRQFDKVLRLKSSIHYLKSSKKEFK